MAYAVELALDDQTGAAVRALWRALADVGVTWMADSGAHPHVSLAIWERIDREPFEAELARFAAELARIPVVLDQVQTFGPDVIFLSPARSPALTDAQRRVHARFTGLADGAWRHYLPELWVPHCTLAMEIPPSRQDEALAIARRASVPIAGRLEAIALVEFRPVVELVRYPLGR